MIQREVRGFRVESGRVTGVYTQFEELYSARAVILTAGTFMRSVMHCGRNQAEGGRAGDTSANSISDSLKGLGFELLRLKTGTPARLKKSSIRFEALQREDGDAIPVPFSFYTVPRPFPLLPQMPCFLTYTNPDTHEVIAGAKEQSPMFSGQILGRGPRYCPSIEDKVFRFADKDRHQIFLEPEGLNTHEYYPNGISTSLPFDIQYELVRSMRGLENAHILRPGYAIEYDYFDPRGLTSHFETRAIHGLFFAGQINGTTGYEEAAAQGLFAGINAALQCRGHAPWLPRRDQAYLGVLVDDLITKGVTEPYRMFTSRAEFRLQLREDNADMRLTELGRELGLVDDARWDAFCRKRDAVSRETERLKSTWVNPQTLSGAEAERVLGKPIDHEHKLFDLLRRPGIGHADLMSLESGRWASDAVSRETLGDLADAVIEQVEIAAKYAGYIERQKDEVERAAYHEQLRLPADLDYMQVSALSIEARQKLAKHRPETLGQASRISGITPATISLLLIHLRKGGLKGMSTQGLAA